MDATTAIIAAMNFISSLLVDASVVRQLSGQINQRVNHFAIWLTRLDPQPRLGAC
jgi:hypothetical protein